MEILEGETGRRAEVVNFASRLYKTAEEGALTGLSLSSLPEEQLAIEGISRPDVGLNLAVNIDAIITSPTREKIAETAREEAARLFSATEDLDDVAAMDVLGLGIAHSAAVLDMFRHQKYGRDFPITGARAYHQHLLSNVAYLAAARVYGRPDRMNLFRNLEITSSTILQSDMPRLHYYAHCVGEFALEAKQALSVLAILDAQPVITDVEARDNKDLSDRLWEEGKYLRDFALKPAIAPTNISGLKEIELKPAQMLYAELNDVLAKRELNSNISADVNPAAFTFEEGVAGIMLSSLPMRSGVRSFDVEPPGSFAFALGRTLESQLEASQDEIARIGTEEKFASLQLRPDGHIYTMYGPSLADLAESFGASEAYEQLRQEILVLHWDLTVPYKIQRLVAEANGAPLPAVTGPAEKVTKRDLVIARIKYQVEKKADIEREAENEVRAETAEQVGKKTIFGYRRQINPEFRAGPEARRLAWEQGGRILAEYGETWVQTHERSDPRVSTGHFAVKPKVGEYATRQQRRQAERQAAKAARRLRSQQQQDAKRLRPTS